MASMCLAVFTLLFFLGVDARCRSNIFFGCARFYEHGQCRGRSLPVSRGESTASIRSGWNDRASSVVVANKCKLTVYEHGNFRVSTFNLLNSVHKYYKNTNFILLCNVF